MYQYTCVCGSANSTPNAHTHCHKCGLEIFLDWDFAIRKVATTPKEPPPKTLTETTTG